MERRDKLVTAIAAIALLAVTTAVITFLVRSAPRPAAPPRPSQFTSPTTSPTTSRTPPPPRQPGVLAVKLDNVGAARPQTGLSTADTIYVEPIEGGATRLVALFPGTRPDVVGPVRSIRETDAGLLAQYGKPVVAFSGAAPELDPVLQDATLAQASPFDFPNAFFRDSGRRMPHNLYVRPGRLPEAEPYRAQPPLDFGPAPPGGSADTGHRVDYDAATYEFTWSSERGRWLVSLNGSPVVSTESGSLGAASVVVQRVEIVSGREITDVVGNPSPVAVTVGSGSATILRDGERFDGAWSRPSATDPTRFTTSDGADLPLAEGPVWILLAPR
jgi:hypothetical protein